MQKNSLSGSIVNELEVAERDYMDRLNAIAKLAEIKSRKVVSKFSVKKEDGSIKTYNYVEKKNK